MPRTDATTPTRSAPRRPITERYAPRDTVLKPAPSTALRTPTARRRSVSDVFAPSVTGTTPNLVPRTSTPRLGAPRTANNRSYAPYRYRWGSYSSCNSSIWNGYWGYGYSSLWGSSGYGWYGSWCSSYAGLGCWGFDPLCWGMGLLSPYAAFRASYWNNCYRSCYWNNWSIPNALPSNYWWYPTTTYCPTYLYVPSSVVIIEEEEVLEPADGSTAELSPDGAEGEVALASDAKSIETAGDGIAAAAASLAEQYVELGDYYFKNGDYAAAAEAYSKARNHMPEDASVHFVLADAVFANGDYHYAAFLIAEGVRLNPPIVSAEVDKREFYGDPKAFEQQVKSENM